MKYYRVDLVLDRNLEFNSFAVQHRKWGIWRTLRVYHNRSDAFMHLDSLHRQELIRREHMWRNSIDRLIARFKHD